MTDSLGKAGESPLLKVDIFRRLDEAAAAGVILASNTSSISITEIAAVTQRADKVIGMHFMNPVPMMKLVEVIRGLATSDETYNTVADLAAKMGKTPVEVNDYPGFVEVRSEFLPAPWPAATLVAVSALVRPEWLVEVEAIAVLR